MRTNQGEQGFSKWLLELWNGTLIADLEPPMRDIIEIPHLCIVRKSIVNELFANITSEEAFRTGKQAKIITKNIFCHPVLR